LSAKISEFTSENLSRLHNLVSNLALNERLTCFGIFSDGKLEGGMFFMETNTKRMYLKGAARKLTRDSGGMYLCMHYAIQEAIQEQKKFDFGGSEVEGVRRFNQNLGGIDQHYYIYDWNKTPFWFKWSKQLYQQWKKK
jgi:lipid II:glycine glycyltransferase (peptidoglycan interpeptide bridge formation enzyme)